MDSSKDKGKGKMIYYNYPSPPPSSSSPIEENVIQIIEFSLIELSLLIRMLRSQLFPDFISENSLKEFTNNILYGYGGNDLFKAFDKSFVRVQGMSFIEKIKTIISYYYFIIESYQDDINPELEPDSIYNKLISPYYRNLFYSFHLFGIARLLIKQFMTFHKDNKYYNELLKQKYFYLNIPLEEISIQDYAQAYDFFEVKANAFMKELRKNEYFEEFPFEFIFNDITFNRNSILMSISEAEASNNYVIYPVQFAPNMSIESYPIIDVYWPIIYTNTIVFSTQITIEVCNNIYQNIYDPNNTHSPLEYFYLFFYNLNKDTQNILKYTTTNEYFLNKILEEPKEYLDEDIVDGFDIVNDMLPPHKHSDLISEICKDHLTLNKRPKEGKHKQRGGGHRRRRGGGHRDGSPSV